ncbi:MAG TPA: SDR family oxidoreductase [Solirubrobacteraceae bacterium]|nr:SDR family oxidoreductase [Solirubrobacteraceae bacterium]
MRVLVTGGAGFIGSNLAARLVQDGHEVRVLDNFSTGHRRNLRPILEDVEVVEGDIQSYERTTRAARGIEVVFHQAAMPSVPRSIEDPLTSTSTNVTGTLNVMLAARDNGARRVVFASSSSIYGANPTLPKHEDAVPQPFSPYAVAKLAGEGYCRAFREVYGLETVALRYFNVFGPHQDPDSHYAAVIPRFILAALRGTAPTVYGDGEQTRDFTYVDNVVEANLLAAEAPGVTSEPMNVACGRRISLNELLAAVAEITGTELRTRYVDPRPGDVRHSHAAIDRAAEQIGYACRVGFREGLERTVAHYRG